MAVYRPQRNTIAVDTVPITKILPAINAKYTLPLPYPLVPIKTKRYKTITLNAYNTLVLKGVVSAKSISKVKFQLLLMSNELRRRDEIYLVLDTPGGSVAAGNFFIDAAKAIPQSVKTVTLIAASMGFHIAQQLGERIITPSGIMMAHNAHIVGLSGEIPGNAITRLNFYLRMVEKVDKFSAQRWGISLSDYHKRVDPEYWAQGEDALRDGVVDRVVRVRCDEELIEETHEESIALLFGKLKVTFSDCPLIRAPIETDISDLKFPSEQAKKDFFKFLETYFYNPLEFTKKYLITGKFKEFLIWP